MGLKKLVVDFEICRTCDEKCAIKCSYPFHPVNDGSLQLRELVVWECVCRRCNQPGCVAACPTEALRKRDDGRISRSAHLCISCKSCTMGCPFGTILPELLPYLTTACDYCLNRLEDNQQPLCVQTCPAGAIVYREVAENETPATPVNGALTGIATAWQKVAKPKA